MKILEALIAGGLIGAVLGFVGAGGAMLSVPILIYLFHFSPPLATTAALAIVFAAALSGAIPKMRSKEILYRDAVVIWGIGLVTNIAGSVIAHRLSDATITTGFASIMIVAGLSMLFNPVARIHRRMPISILIFISLIIGAMTGLFGIGGGFLAIPILVLFFATPHSVAAGTSLLIIAMNSFTSFLAHAHMWSEVSWSIPLTMAGAAIVVAQLASRASLGVSAKTLRRFFAALMFSVATFTLVKTWLL